MAVLPRETGGGASSPGSRSRCRMGRARQHTRTMTGRRDVLDVVAGLADLAHEQSDVCSRAQLAALGVNAKAIDAHVLNRRWRRLGPLVVALHCGPLTPEARRWAVVLNAGAGAALGAWTALHVWGLRGWERDAVHLVVRRGSHPAPLPSVVGPVVVHESRRHRPEDVRSRNGLPIHSPERSAIDGGAWSPTSRAACGLLAAVVQQGLTTAQLITAELDTAGRIRWLRVMAAALADIAGGSHALSEIDFVRFCRKHGLPEPVRQVVRRDSSGRRRYLDVEWRLPDGRRLALEIDGVGHLEVERWYDDLLRAAELMASGGTDGPLLRLPAIACRTEPDRVARILRVLLAPAVSASTPLYGVRF